MKYQIYLQKDVTEFINGIASAMNQAPSTFIKQYLEENFRAVIQEVRKEDSKHNVSPK